MSEPKGTPKSEPQGSKKPDLLRGEEVLKGFKKKIDDALKELRESEGGRLAMEAQRLTPRSVHGDRPFPEANAVLAQYNKVHSHLTELSRKLDDQIFMFGVAVEGADKGFDRVSAEDSQRYWAIQAELEQEKRRAEAEKHAKDGKREDTGANDQDRPKL
ncbi:hypothetical protein FM076_24965 [Streptomyces albus subsp. chlorinus]|uniref:hypothetical protein n=1 Tax=Streptomyces albus TaxID=1888 RepID=UPI00156DBFAF|nr:hypothetical protein [Streptomyces albus]NSC24220.1 hypothetical protein [Streptomyces albus subsp. chlorinus]